MRRFLWAMVALFVPAFFAGCCGPETQTVPLTQQYSAPTCAPMAAANPCYPQAAPVYSAPATVLAAPAPVGIQYRVGPAEHARAALSIPPNMAACLVTGGYKVLMAGVDTVNCLANQIIPTPTPTATYVYPVMQYQPTVPFQTYSAPCLPAAPVVAPRAAPAPVYVQPPVLAPPPVVYPQASPCVGCCTVPGARLGS